MTLLPIGNRIMVKVFDSEKKQGNIYIPDNATVRPQIATVISCGEGDYDVTNNRYIPTGFAPDDVIVFIKHAGSNFILPSENEQNKSEYTILDVIDVLGKLIFTDAVDRKKIVG